MEESRHAVVRSGAGIGPALAGAGFRVWEAGGAGPDEIARLFAGLRGGAGRGGALVNALGLREPGAAGDGDEADALLALMLATGEAIRLLDGSSGRIINLVRGPGATAAGARA